MVTVSSTPDRRVNGENGWPMMTVMTRDDSVATRGLAGRAMYESPRGAHASTVRAVQRSPPPRN
jgi:hypothetical protein